MFLASMLQTLYVFGTFSMSWLTSRSRMFQIRFMDHHESLGGKVGIMFACHMFLIPGNQW